MEVPKIHHEQYISYLYKSSWSIYKLSIYEIENPICYMLSSIEKIWILKTLFLIYHGALIIEENWQKHVHHKLSKTVYFSVFFFFFFFNKILCYLFVSYIHVHVKLWKSFNKTKDILLIYVPLTKHTGVRQVLAGYHF